MVEKRPQILYIYIYIYILVQISQDYSFQPRDANFYVRSQVVIEIWCSE